LQEKAAKEEERRRMLELMEEERELMDIPPGSSGAHNEQYIFLLSHFIFVDFR